MSTSTVEASCSRCVVTWLESASTSSESALRRASSASTSAATFERVTSPVRSASCSAAAIICAPCALASARMLSARSEASLRMPSASSRASASVASAVRWAITSVFVIESMFGAGSAAGAGAALRRALASACSARFCSSSTPRDS